MKKDLVLSIDYGTQSVRVAIVDRNGHFLAIEKEKYDEPYFSIKPGYCEQYPQYYYDNMCKAAKRLSSAHPDLLERCMSVSQTAFRDTPAFLDENMDVVRPSIIWLDQRQAKLKRKIPKLYSLIFWLVGMKDTIILNRKRTPALWLQENEEENWKKIKHYVSLPFYFAYRLTGNLTESPSNSIGHFPLNFKKGKQYGPKALKGIIFGIENSQLPKLTPIGETIGFITEKSHEETGFPVGLKLIASGNDKACEAFGCGAIDERFGHVSYGTSSTISVFTKNYVNPEPFLPSYVGCYKGGYNAEVQIYRGYWMLTWFLKEFGESETVEAQIEKIAPEEILNKKLSEIPPGSNGLIVQPYWGPGLRRPLAKGAIIGFYDVHTRVHIYRAIIEGIAYALLEGLEGIVKKTRKKIEALTISGGGSKSDAICQITADIFNIKVIKNDTYEASSLGCAMSQYVSNGIYKSPTEAKEKMVRYVKTFTPNKEAVEKYKYLFNNVYINIYPNLAKTYRNLTKYLQVNNEGSID